jgi:hypothetical protein
MIGLASAMPCHTPALSQKKPHMQLLAYTSPGLLIRCAELCVAFTLIQLYDQLSLLL